MKMSVQTTTNRQSVYGVTNRIARYLILYTLVANALTYVMHSVRDIHPTYMQIKFAIGVGLALLTDVQCVYIYKTEN